MNFTPEERLIRDSYLAKSNIHFPISIEMVLLVVSVGAFVYGFFISEDGQPMVCVAFCLSLIAAGRYIYSARVYHPHIASLIRKYEDTLSEKLQKIEPSGSLNPLPPSAPRDR